VAPAASFDVAEVGDQARAHCACRLDLSGRALGKIVQKVRVVLDLEFTPRPA
jgi:hypothetical protein